MQWNLLICYLQHSFARDDREGTFKYLKQEKRQFWFQSSGRCRGQYYPMPGSLMHHFAYLGKAVWFTYYISPYVRFPCLCPLPPHVCNRRAANPPVAPWLCKGQSCRLVCICFKVLRIALLVGTSHGREPVEHGGTIPAISGNVNYRGI